MLLFYSEVNKLQREKNMKVLRIAREIFWFYGFKVFCRIRKPYFKPLKFLLELPERISEKIQKREYLTPKTIPKKIWIFWAQGWDSAPPLVKLCRDSWIANNPDWEIVSLSEENISQYIHLDYSLEGKEVPFAAYADIIRVSLLSKYGGVWADATTLCSTPLSNWLPFLVQSGFFAFTRKDITITNWFLASEQNNILVKNWEECIGRYWQFAKKPERYFWVQYLFEYLLKHNSKARNVWRKTPKVSADGPYAAQRCLRREGHNLDECLDMVFGNKAPLHKLSLRVEFSDLFLRRVRRHIDNS